MQLERKKQTKQRKKKRKRKKERKKIVFSVNEDPIIYIDNQFNNLISHFTQ